VPNGTPTASNGSGCLSTPAQNRHRHNGGIILNEPGCGRGVTTDPPELLLAHHFKTLRLPTFLREHDKQASICAAEGVDHVRDLARLTELELIDRERRMVERRINSAKFPDVKNLYCFGFKAIPSLNKMMLLELASCEWIERPENVIALAPSGACKIHVALELSDVCD